MARTHAHRKLQHFCEVPVVNAGTHFAQNLEIRPPLDLFTKHLCSEEQVQLLLSWLLLVLLLLLLLLLLLQLGLLLLLLSGLLLLLLLGLLLLLLLLLLLRPLLLLLLYRSMFDPCNLSGSTLWSRLKPYECFRRIFVP